MKKALLICSIVVTALCAAPVALWAQAQQTQTPTVDSIAPVVVKTVPEAGSKDVSPGVTEIKVKFSKEMADQSWSWTSAWKDSTPEGLGKPRYEPDHRTCVLKVKLERNKTYGYWINNQRFHGFQDTHGHPAVPYLLVFQTKAQ